MLISKIFNTSIIETIMKKNQIKLILFIFLIHLLFLLVTFNDISHSTDGETYEAWMSILMILDFPLSILLLILSICFREINILFQNILVLMLIFQILGTINWTILISTIMYKIPSKKQTFFLCCGIGLITGIITLVLDHLLYNSTGFDITHCVIVLLFCIFSGIYVGFIAVFLHCCSKIILSRK
jgi:hypothetical protein